MKFTLQIRIDNPTKGIKKRIMETVKNCTDLEQSEKLAEILPLESADMYRIYDIPYAIPYENRIGEAKPCWSLAALLDVLPTGKVLLHDKRNHGYKCICNNIDTDYFNNPVDACYAMIEKLHELKRL